MNLAKISANGQITVPVEIRRLLDLQTGDKILIYQNDSGEVVMEKAAGGPAPVVKKAAPAKPASEMLSEKKNTRALIDALQFEQD